MILISSLFYQVNDSVSLIQKWSSIEIQITFQVYHMWSINSELIQYFLRRFASHPRGRRNKLLCPVTFDVTIFLIKWPGWLWTKTDIQYSETVVCVVDVSRPIPYIDYNMIHSYTFEYHHINMLVCSHGNACVIAAFKKNARACRNEKSQDEIMGTC